jgi:hypothetical protein
MLCQLLRGAAAGAVGTVALDAVGYLDMAIRGRAASELPGKVAGQLLHDLGLPLVPDTEGPNAAQARNRQAALGALMGYTVGVGVGAAYGMTRSLLPRVPLPLASIGLGLAAMAASDVPMVKLGATDPTTWGVSGWVSDLLPHLAYGLAAAIAYEACAD